MINRCKLTNYWQCIYDSVFANLVLKKKKMITVVLIKVITVIIFTRIKKTLFAFNFTNNPDKIF